MSWKRHSAWRRWRAEIVRSVRAGSVPYCYEGLVGGIDRFYGETVRGKR